MPLALCPVSSPRQPSTPADDIGVVQEDQCRRGRAADDRVRQPAARRILGTRAQAHRSIASDRRSPIAISRAETVIAASQSSTPRWFAGQACTAGDRVNARPSAWQRTDSFARSRQIRIALALQAMPANTVPRSTACGSSQCARSMLQQEIRERGLCCAITLPMPWTPCSNTAGTPACAGPARGRGRSGRRPMHSTKIRWRIIKASDGPTYQLDLAGNNWRYISRPLPLKRLDPTP